MAIMAIVFAAIVPQFRVIQNNWDSKQGAAETLQNGRVLIDHLYRNLMTAVRITAVSGPDETNGYIEFEDNDGDTMRYDIAANNYVEFGTAGDLSDLAGPVSQFQFTCYDACDLDSPLDPITDANLVRFVKVQTTLTNSASLGQNKTLIASVYLRTNSSSSSTSTKMYWTDTGARKLQRANLDGSSVEDILTGLSNKMGHIALDVAAGKMYWVSSWNDITRADLEGSNIEQLVTGLSRAFGIALDVSGGKMYWTDFGSKKIQRADLDGSNVYDLITGLNKPRGIALDVTAGKMYWTDAGAKKLQRANLDGSNVEDILTGLSNKMGYIALDVAAGKMYWVSSENDITRADLDGSNVEQLVTGLSRAFGIALDVSGGKMYWTDFGSKKIQRADLDGSNVYDLITGLSKPQGIALGEVSSGGQILP